MIPFKALFEARNNELIDAFYATVVCITSDNGQHTIWYLDQNKVLKCANANSYTITNVEGEEV
jgi:hypothetical protein